MFAEGNKTKMSYRAGSIPVPIHHPGAIATRTPLAAITLAALTASQLLLGISLALAVSPPAAADAVVKRSPLEIGTSLDLGQIVKGVAADENPVLNVDGQMIQRTGVYFNQTTEVGDRLDIKVGVGGLFFYGFPERRNQAGSRSVRFGPGVGQAQALYAFGDPEAPSGFLQFGYFPYKYNPDAKNLGEYLLRSGTYPGYQLTGGWSIINSAAYMASGLRLHGEFLGGDLGLDANLFLEHDLEPLYDLSPSLVAAWQPSPVFAMGAGVQFSHLLPAHPSKLRSRGAKYLGDTLASPGDSGAVPYTFQGVKLMARLSLNLGALVESPWVGPEGLKLYAEAAVLGVKDYPYYYSDVTRRIPILLGLNLPGFRFFDMLAVEGEYRKWDFPNNTQEVLESVDPLWAIPGADPALYSPKNASARGNLKWTVFARKRLMEAVNLYAQAASDHMRGIDWEKAVLGRTTITQRPSQWYYLFRLEFGI